jgi:hypothetical protein
MRSGVRAGAARTGANARKGPEEAGCIGLRREGSGMSRGWDIGGRNTFVRGSFDNLSVYTSGTISSKPTTVI